jgi:hypothetical protein
MSAAKIVFPVVVVVAAMISAVAAYSFHSRSIARTAPAASAATSPQPASSARVVPVLDEEVLSGSPSWKQWPPLTDF